MYLLPLVNSRDLSNSATVVRTAADVCSSLEADLHPSQIVRSVPGADTGTPEVATFLIKGVDHHKNDCIPVIADFVLCGEKINLNMSMG